MAKYGQHKNSESPRRPPPPPGSGPSGKYPRNLFGWLLIILIGAMMFSLMTDLGLNREEIPYSEFEKRVRNGEVKEVTISGNHLTGTMRDEALKGKDTKSQKKFEVTLPGPGEPAGLIELLRENDVLYRFEQPSTFVQILISLLPWLLLIGIMYFFIFRQFRGAGGAGMLGSFGRSRHRIASKEQSKVTFEDVAGIDEAKEEVQEIIQFLRNPKKFQRLGGRIPRGVLLVGAPGCGKTLLAKAIAGEADVPFFSISGSDFVEMFVGVGASRVRDLFKQAKENSPCIIFLDEIDAVGRKRGVGVAVGGHDEREQTLNAILVEMDGFETNDQVIVIAATNRADVLDHALTRPGRFDRQISVPLPDIKGRLEILKVHAKKIKMGPNIDLHRLARGTPMFSGADLEAIINEAALAATMSNKECVEMGDLEEARDKVRWGRARRSRVIDEKEKVATAFHEAGHALIQSLSEYADPLHKVSIIPRGDMGGATFSLPEKDRTMYTKKYCLAEIRICFGGRVAEEVFCNDISSGAQADIKMATEIARRMVMEWGMSDKLGFVRYGGEGYPNWFGDLSGNREYSERTAELIDTEIKTIMDAAYQDVKKLIDSHHQVLMALHEALIKYETLDGDEVKQLIKGKPLDKPTVGELLAAEQNRLDAKVKKSKPETDPSSEGGLSNPIPNPGLG